MQKTKRNAIVNLTWEFPSDKIFTQSAIYGGVIHDYCRRLLDEKKGNEMLGFIIVFVAIVAIRYISDWFKK